MGSHILNSSFGTRISTHYWADGDNELDFVLARGPSVLGIEVKTSASHTMPRGLQAFLRAHPNSTTMLIGPAGTDLEKALTTPVDEYF